MAEKTFRTTLTLPVELARDLADCAKDLGCSQSALVAAILQSPVGKLAMYLALSPGVDRDGPVLRYRGDSRERIELMVAEAVAASMAPDRLL